MGIIFPHGDRDGEKSFPVTIDRDGDGDGHSFSTEEFSVDIFNSISGLLTFVCMCLSAWLTWLGP